MDKYMPIATIKLVHPDKRDAFLCDNPESINKWCMWFLSGEKIETLFLNLIKVTLHKSKAGTINIIKSKSGKSFLWIAIALKVSVSRVSNFNVKSPNTRPITRDPVSLINIFFREEKL